MTKPDRRDVFVCYSHRDARWLDRLETMLAPLRATAPVVLWSDRRIEPGEVWREEIERALASAKVAVLLVSPHFFASRFVTTVELPTILDSVEHEGVKVVWVPLSDSLYRLTPIARYQAALDPSRPLDSLPRARRNSALVSVCNVIEEMLRAPVPTRSPQPHPATPLAAPDAGTPAPGAGVPAETVQLVLPADLAATLREELAGTTEASSLLLTYGGLVQALHGLPPGALASLYRVELGIYALPILQEWHPVLRSSGEELRSAWIDGLLDVVRALLDHGCCPGLQRLDIKVVNRVPALVTAVLTSTRDARSTVSMLHAPVLEGEDPADTPVTLLASAAGAVPPPAVRACARIVDNLRSQGNPLTFPVVGDGRCVRHDLPAFVRSLSTVCNHPRYGLADALYSVQLQVSEQLAREQGWTALLDAPHLGPEAVYRCFDQLRESGRAQLFQVDVDPARERATIRVGSTHDGGRLLRRDVDGRHIVGAFALITRPAEDGYGILLKKKLKPPWEYDVPGGKVAGVDASLAATVAREIFEEMGFLPDERHLGAPIAYKYDPRSQKEGVPVIAVYFHYPLASDDAVYLDSFRPPDGADDDEYPLVTFSAAQLLADKRAHRQRRRADVDDAEARCHAPLEAVAYLVHDGR